jgi:hypothetical protein
MKENDANNSAFDEEMQQDILIGMPGFYLYCRHLAF